MLNALCDLPYTEQEPWDSSAAVCDVLRSFGLGKPRQSGELEYWYPTQAKPRHRINAHLSPGIGSKWPMVTVEVDGVTVHSFATNQERLERFRVAVMALLGEPC